jgi:Protein of unknown function (DUF1559)
MFTRPSRVAAALALAAGLALPACDKKKDAGGGGGDSGPPPGYSGSKGGPPRPGGDPGAGGGVQDPSLPTPPAAPRLGATDARARQISKNNLKQVGLALHNFHSVYNAFPSGIADKTGKVGLSWRVSLLPYLDQVNLYKEFKLDEPWDSEHNKKLIASMPKLYAPPGVETKGYTYYRSFSGQGAFLPPPSQPGRPGQEMFGLRIAQITDGTSNTIAVAEAAEPVIWTKPEDLPFTPGKPPKLGGVFDTGFHALLCDGSVPFIPSSIDPKTLSNLIQTNDGNVVNIPGDR